MEVIDSLKEVKIKMKNNIVNPQSNKLYEQYLIQEGLKDKIFGNVGKSFAQGAGKKAGEFFRGMAQGAAGEELSAAAKNVNKASKALKYSAYSVFAIFGTAVAAKIAKATAVAARNFEECHRKCKGLNRHTDSLSNVCLLNCRIARYKEVLMALEGACSESKYPVKCKAAVERKAEKLKQQISNLERQVKYYKH